MEGIITYIYRNAYNRYFGGIDKYFTPFIASKKMNSHERSELLPEHNKNMTVNPNLGCPSGAVTERKRGAGFFGVPKLLDEFLCAIFEKSPLKISIKTRILSTDCAPIWTPAQIRTP